MEASVEEELAEDNPGTEALMSPQEGLSHFAGPGADNDDDDSETDTESPIPVPVDTAAAQSNLKYR